MCQVRKVQGILSSGAQLQTSECLPGTRSPGEHWRGCSPGPRGPRGSAADVLEGGGPVLDWTYLAVVLGPEEKYLSYRMYVPGGALWPTGGRR